MFCPQCGTQLNDNAVRCSNCGKEFVQAQQQSYQQQSYQQQSYQQQPYQQQPYQQPYQPNMGYQQPYQPNMGYQQPYQPPMKWFKFLIYFSLFLSAVVNGITAITFFTGSQYDGYADWVYAFFSELKALDMIMGIASLGFAGFAIYTRMRLAGFYRNGPRMINLMYVFSIIINLVYLIGVLIIVDADLDLNYSSYIGNVIGNAIMIAINSAYFKKRAHLFVN